MATFIPRGSGNDEADIGLLERELGLSSEQLPEQLKDLYARLSLLLTTDELAAWRNESLTLFRLSSPRSPEAMEEYFRVTPQVLDILPFPLFLSWINRGKVLCRDNPDIAAAYFRASPEVLTTLLEAQIKVWLAIGPGLYKRNMESMELARHFLDATPALLQVLNLAQLERLLLFLNRLAETSNNLAAMCLNSAHQVFKALEEDERGLYLSIALSLIRLKPMASVTFFEQGVDALASITSTQRIRFLSILVKLAGYNSRHALSFLTDCPHTLSGMNNNLHYLVLSQVEAVLTISAIAGIEFLKNSPTVLAAIGLTGLERWYREGLRILRKDEKEGLAYFRLEFTEDGTLERLLVRVELEHVRGVLLMYGEALGGSEIEIRPSDSLADWSLGTIHPGITATDGTVIFLPSSVERFDSTEENFTWYKAAVTHQSGHIEFGTFNFCFEREAAVFSDRRRLLSTDGHALSDIDRFLGLFDDRRLAADIFSLVEDVRIDYLVQYRYAGIRSGYRFIQQEAVWRRPSPVYLPLREAFLEIVIRFSLEGELPFVPEAVRGPTDKALRLLRQLRSPQATVEDSAEVAIRLYDIASIIPNTRLPEREWNTGDSGPARSNRVDTSYRSSDVGDVSIEPSAEVPYQAPTDVDFRGNSHPDMLHVQSVPKDGSDRGTLSPLSSDIGEVQLSSMMQGKNLQSGTYTADLPSEAQPADNSSLEQDGNPPDSNHHAENTSLAKEGQSFLYDEWDFHMGYYRPNWCRVKERLVPEGDTAYFEGALADNHSLAVMVRKQFEMINPELLRKSDRLYDGEELDLDAVVRAVVDKKAGSISDERIYWKRRKVQRDVAAIILVDMSASTGSIIKDTQDEYPDWYLDLLEESRRSAVWRGEPAIEKPRRVIDVMKESIVLMTNALEGTGDCYGIYGFSGHGRENVEILVVKGIEETFSGIVKGRVGNIAPLRSTRMGSAIRHVTSKLDAHDARTKLLILVSDGYPQDEDYSHDDADKEYALQDTRMAFIEAKRKNILPFCLTVDTAGHDYLKRICHDINYEIVNDIESLPQRLPALYKKLTT